MAVGMAIQRWIRLVPLVVAPTSTVMVRRWPVIVYVAFWSIVARTVAIVAAICVVGSLLCLVACLRSQIQLS